MQARDLSNSCICDHPKQQHGVKAGFCRVACVLL